VTHPLRDLLRQRGGEDRAQHPGRRKVLRQFRQPDHDRQQSRLGAARRPPGCGEHQPERERL